MIRLTTGSEACGREASHRAGEARPVPLTRLPLVRGLRPPDATGSRHTTRPAHAGVGGHHTTVSPLFFIAYPQTRVPASSMLGPCPPHIPYVSSHDGQPTVLYCVPTNPGPRSFYAWAVRRCHWPVPQPIVRLLPLLRSYPPFPKSTDPYSISRSQI